jgi:hypothetical protein
MNNGAPNQVHFIAKQQKFYQISPQRGDPLLFDRRPYTSSVLQHVLSKRSSGKNANIAALYLAQQQNGAGGKFRSPQDFLQTASQFPQAVPYSQPSNQGQKKRFI